MSDNEAKGSGGGREKGETSESGMRPPKNLVMGEEDISPNLSREGLFWNDRFQNCHSNKLPPIYLISRMRTK
jgi:hypothetical protein